MREYSSSYVSAPKRKASIIVLFSAAILSSSLLADVDAVAADDNADVPALHGWRRELFGEKALALKHGKLALAIERGRVSTVERDLTKAQLIEE